MAGKSLMSAVVRVKPDMSGFKEELVKGASAAGKTTAEGLQTQLGQAGENAGKEFGGKFTRDANGRLRDERGKFVKVGTETGEALGEGISKGAEGSLGQLSARLNKSFGSMQALGAKMSIGITAPLVLLGKQSLNTFSELEDASAAASVFYGDQVAEIEKFASSADKNFGVSKRAAYELANGLAPLLKQFTAADQMGAEAVEALARTADMASFFGGSVDDAAGAVASFLSGASTEPIRRFGVFANEAAVAAKAVELGLVGAEVSTAAVTSAQARLAGAQAKVNKLAKDGKVGSIEYQKAQADVLKAEDALEKAFDGKIPQLEDAIKIQARYAILMEQTDQAAGDFARTSDSLANTTKATKAAMENQAAVVGEKLAPHMIKLQEHLLVLLERFARLPEGTQRFIIMGAAVAAVAGPMLTLVGTIGKLSTSLITLAARWMGVSAAATTAAGAQGAAGAAGAAASASVGGLLAKLGIGAAAFAGGYGIGTVLNNKFGISDKLANAINGVPGQADGGITMRPGLSWVGEQGPELLSLPRGAEVRPLDKVGGDTYNINVEVTGRAADDPAALARELDRLSRRASATVRTRRIP